jgi:GT2 family glycosyltransferase
VEQALKPAATVVVVHHRGPERLMRTLEEAVRQAAAEACEVVLVDNASAEGAVGRVSRAFPSVRCERSATNSGFARGCRLGVEAARSDAAVFLNDDAVPEPGWLANLLAAWASRPEDVSAIAGRLTDASGELNDFSDGFVTFDGHAFAAHAGAPAGKFPAGDPGDERLFACGGNMVVSRKEFLDSGGFDDDYFAYLEDVDFGWRQWIFGRRIAYEPRACARHEGGATGQALGVFRRGYLIEKNAFSTAYKNLDDRHLRDFLPSIFATFLSRLAAMIAQRNPEARSLTADPYRELDGGRRGRARRALARWLGVRLSEDRAALSDPLTIAQLRALEAIFRERDRLAEKRRWVQSRRQRPDSAIFAKFPPAIVPTYPGDDFFSGPFFESIRPAEVELAARTLSEIFWKEP